MIVASRRLAVLDELRVPVRDADPAERAALDAAEPRLSGWDGLWWEGGTGSVLRYPTLSPDQLALPVREHRLLGVRVFGQVVRDEVLREALEGVPGSWTAADPVVDRDGHPVASVWRSDAGDVVLPFDPDQALWSLLSERYVEATGTQGARATAVLVGLYYRLRPLLPRALQIRLRRAYSRVQQRSRFPSWPVEPAAADLRVLLLDVVAGICPEPVPWLAPWPDGADWALVLTHDVEGPAGYERLPVLRDLELELGFRSAWNFVPCRYEVDDDLRRELLDTGFEVGVHGLVHDGRDLALLEERLPQIQARAQEWGAAGFRFPATHRRWSAMGRLPFDFDSSYPDSDPFEPQAGGCCSWWPFFIGGLVELPITLPQDHTLFAILRHRGAATWLAKAEAVRARGGMVLVITHPDYLDGTPLEDAYRELLTACRDQPGTWHALPREVSAWWRQRAASVPVRTCDGWCVQGPAAGRAQVRLAHGTVPRPGDGRVTAPRP